MTSDQIRSVSQSCPTLCLMTYIDTKDEQVKSTLLKSSYTLQEVV